MLVATAQFIARQTQSAHHHLETPKSKKQRRTQILLTKCFEIVTAGTVSVGTNMSEELKKRAKTRTKTEEGN